MKESKTSLVPLDKLIPSPTNARTHDDAQVAELVASINEFGWTNPILIDPEGNILAGHGRLAAARALGLAKVPCITLTGLTPTQAKAYLLADNKLALNAGWDLGALKDALVDLADAGYDLGLAGFRDDELSILMAPDPNAGLTDENAVPPVPECPVSQPGDVWVLGRHRILCGDSTDADCVEKVLAGVKPHLMVTDPPYGVNYDASWREKALGVTGLATGKVLNDDRADWREAWALAPCTVAYVWHGGTKAAEVAASLQACKFNIRAQIVWVKSRHVLSRRDYHAQHEPLYYATREEAAEHWTEDHEVLAYAVKAGEPGKYRGGRKQSTVWFIDHFRSETGHSTQKPVECMRRPVENNSNPGQAVYEPFSGSGTTIIACEQTGRTCLAIELSPAYVDVAVRRWEEFTGKDATLEGDGRTFKALSAAPVVAE